MEPVPANALDHGDLILIPVRVVDTDTDHAGGVRITYQAVDADADGPRGGLPQHRGTSEARRPFHQDAQPLLQR